MEDLPPALRQVVVVRSRSWALSITPNYVFKDTALTLLSDQNPDDEVMYCRIVY